MTPTQAGHVDDPSRGVTNAQLAMAAVITAELMLFAGLIGAYLVFRLREPVWPPAGLPQLPIGITTLNTIGLIASAVLLRRAVAALRAGNESGAAELATQTAGLGVVFVCVQGFEWARLVLHGWTLSNVYGGAFYLLIGCHALHVVGGVTILLAVTWAVRRGHVTRERPTSLLVATTYWNFVTLLWLGLFPLVYLY